MMASTKSSSMKSAFGNNKQVKQVKRVAFSEMSQLVCVQRKTDAELKEVWYSREETNEFRSNAVIYSGRLLCRKRVHIFCNHFNNIALILTSRNCTSVTTASDISHPPPN
jgi:hypothetical protein